MKLGICNEIFAGWNIEETLEFVHGLGYHGLEIAPFTLCDSVEDISKTARDRIRLVSEKNGMEIIGTHWLLVKPEGLSISSPDKSIREKTMHYFEKLVLFTADIGGRIMVLGSPKQRSIGAGQAYEEVAGYMREVLACPLELAKENGVIVCLEPLGRKETNFINTAEEAISFIRSMNHPNLKLILDVKAMSDEGRPYGEIIRKSAGYLRHFHANDENLLGPGFGDVDYTPIIMALKEGSFHGFVSVEVFDFSPGPEAIARKSIEYLKRFIA